MASITKRGSSWFARVYVNGSRVAKSFKLKAMAIAWVQAQEKAMLTGKMLDGNRSVREALEKYRDEVAPLRNGSRWEIVRMDKFIRTLPFVDKALADLTVTDVCLWRDSQTNKPGTIRREMSMLGAVLELARREWRWVNENVMRDVGKPTEPRPRSRLISPAEIKAMCGALGFEEGRPATTMREEVAVAFLLAIETAMRSGELLSLTPDQVDLDRRVAHLDKTKNGDARDVPLSLRAVELFRLVPKGFTVRDGSRDAIFRQARDRAGLEGFTFHDARALALTRLSKKVDVLTLARIAGHRSLKSLMVYYREAAEDIAKRLG